MQEIIKKLKFKDIGTVINDQKQWKKNGLNLALKQHGTKK